MASVGGTPSCSRRRENETSTSPLRTATPNSAMKPMPAEMLKGMPRIQSAKTPPMVANGMFTKIRIAGRISWKASHSMKTAA